MNEHPDPAAFGDRQSARSEDSTVSHGKPDAEIPAESDVESSRETDELSQIAAKFRSLFHEEEEQQVPKTITISSGHTLERLSVLGRGGNGLVYKCREQQTIEGQTTTRTVAVKLIRHLPDGGEAHWALVIGWNKSKGRVILHDPGSRYGAGIEYTVADFEASWKTSNRLYVPVWK
jgi:hypothetical protein